MLWAFPAGLRHAAASALVGSAVKGTWTWLTRPRTATVLHGAAIWIWHLPALFDATIVDLTLHRLQHLSFLVTALLFWWSVLRRSSRGVAVWHLFVTMVHTSVLGALMALAPRVLYHLQTADAPAFGLTPLEDQQFAGIIMWVPGRDRLRRRGAGHGGALDPRAAWQHVARARRPASASSFEDAGEALATLRSAPASRRRAACCCWLRWCWAACVGMRLATRMTIARALTRGNPRNAPALVRRFGCGGCHTIAGIRGADGLVAPPLEHLRERVFIGGVVRNSPEKLVRWIVAPQSLSPQTAMPATGIDADQARDIAAYLYAH